MGNTMTTLTLAEALHALGSSPDAVAESLTAGGWHGKPLDSAHCPVACYLAALGFREPSIDQQFASAAEEEQDEETPDAIAEFITAFDEGKYPTLVSPHIADSALPWHDTVPCPGPHECETLPPPAGEEVA